MTTPSNIQNGKMVRLISVLSFVPLPLPLHPLDQKKEGMEIIGYARKSQGTESPSDRTRLLRRMVDNLRTRSLVNQVYASPSSSASEKLANRDDNGVAPLEGTDGTMQQLIEYLDTSGKEICLVCWGMPV
ncbi:hypothetical protein [Absidia glauca]|uniref:Uncharacterized protein n=1 Tax=Absidia glauca TaxID=4829 RepID=A0A168TCI6_ABSGL|nr:hypothetical protein [Absidia glauca]